MDDVFKTQGIAQLRIHERSIGRVKNFHILEGVIPITKLPLISKIFLVCCWLTNLDLPPVDGKKELTNVSWSIRWHLISFFQHATIYIKHEYLPHQSILKFKWILKNCQKKPFADDIINTNMHLLQGWMYILDIFRHLDIHKYLICIQQWVNLFHVEVY